MADSRHQKQSLPIANYSSAVARAIEWLGNGYLLAKPINAAPRPAARAMTGISKSTGGQSVRTAMPTPSDS
jgi:hypothetical protein